MTTTSSTSTHLPTDDGSPLERLLAAIAAGEGVPVDVFTSGAELDAVVPGWRFGLTGAGTIAAQFTSWFADPGAIEELRRLPFAGGEVVEFTVTWTEQGIPHAARQIHVVDLDETGRVVRDQMWCGGRWSASLLAEMEAARHDG